jgi:hypothetical protein
MQTFHLGILLTLLIPTGLCAQALAPARSEAFLASLAGAWQGQAIMTPVGPRPYDINFQRNTQGHLEGEANPGAAIHYWTFYQENGHLTLRFLSTFAGNRQPLFLQATGEAAAGVIRFRARQPDFLAVHVRPATNAATIRVFLHGQLHVDIRLTKAGDS